MACDVCIMEPERRNVASMSASRMCFPWAIFALSIRAIERREVNGNLRFTNLVSHTTTSKKDMKACQGEGQLDLLLKHAINSLMPDGYLKHSTVKSCEGASKPWKQHGARHFLPMQAERSRFEDSQKAPQFQHRSSPPSPSHAIHVVSHLAYVAEREHSISTFLSQGM